MKTKTYEIEGVGSSLLMHNGRLVDPQDEYVMRIRKITPKRKKTEKDLEQLAKLEFFGGLYMNGNGPQLPGKVLKGALYDAGKKRKLGKAVKAGVFCDDADLEYEGPRTKEDLWEKKEFRSRERVVVNKAGIMRTRPQFEKWAAKITVHYDEASLSGEELDDIVTICGRQIGLCDWRPQHGRFKINSVKE